MDWLDEISTPVKRPDDAGAGAEQSMTEWKPQGWAGKIAAVMRRGEEGAIQTMDALLPGGLGKMAGNAAAEFTGLAPARQLFEASSYDELHPLENSARGREQRGQILGAAPLAAGAAELGPKVAGAAVDAALSGPAAGSRAAQRGALKIGEAGAEMQKTPEFQNWFSGSKVVDEQGQPLTVYHGRGGDFEAFNVDGKTKTKGSGAFFSSSPDVAATYTKAKDANIVPVHLNLKQPLVVDANGSNWGVLDLRKHPEIKSQFTFPPTTDQLSRWAKKNGYDGMIVKNVTDFGANAKYSNEASGEPTTIYAAFEPTQIKSAVGNRGTYDPEDPSILHGASAGAAAGAAGAQTMDKKDPQDAGWLDEVSSPAEDNSYDMSEYSTPANESHLDKAKRLARETLKSAQEVNPMTGKPEISGHRLLTEGLKGAGEAALQGITGMAGAAAGGLYALTQADESKDTENVQKVQRALTYEPRTAAGKLASEMGSAPIELASEYLGKGAGAVGSLVGPKTEAAAQTAGENLIPIAGTLAGGRAALERPPIAKSSAGVAAGAAGKDTLTGVGAARVPEADLRRARARELDVPIEITKGQASREPGQQKFEKETAKLPEGELLRNRISKQNEDIMSNFDVWADQTGAEQTSLRAVGEVVTKAIVEKAKAAKAKINAAYNAARDAGDMREQVPYGALQMYLEDQVPATMEQAPALKTAQQLLKKHDPQGTGLISINDLEKIRQVVGGEGGLPGTPNALHVRRMKEMIDGATAEAGGDLYRAARRMRENYAKEFGDRAVVAKLLRNKPGTADRAVALEDVFDHSVLKGSLDDVRHMRRVLQTAGDAGRQAWRELQGATINHIKETIFKGVKDEKGNRTISPHQLGKVIDALDKDGKLDFIFGKAGGEKLRTVRDVADDLFTSPASAGINTSNTGTYLAGLLDAVIIAGSHGTVPAPVASMITLAMKKQKSRNLLKKVKEAVGEEPPPPAPPVPPAPAFRMDGKPNLQPVPPAKPTFDEAAEALRKQYGGGTP